MGLDRRSARMCYPAQLGLCHGAALQKTLTPRFEMHGDCKYLHRNLSAFPIVLHVVVVIVVDAHAPAIHSDSDIKGISSVAVPCFEARGE